MKRDDVRQRLEGELKEAIVSSLMAQKNRVDRIQEVERIVDEAQNPPSNVPFEGASQVHIPLITEQVDTAHIMILKVILSSVPMCVFSLPFAGLDESVRQHLERSLGEFTDVAMRRGGIRKTLSNAVWHSLIGGTGIVRTRWARKKRSIVTDSGKTEIRDFAGAVYDFIPRREFFLVPAHAPNIASAKGCGHLYSRRMSQIEALSKTGFYDPDTPERLRGASQGRGETAERLRELGIGISEQALKDEAEVPLVEIIWNTALDGEARDYVIQYSSGMVLSVSEFPYWHGRRYYIPIYVKPRANMFDGRGIGLMLKGINDEVDAQHRQYIDAVVVNIASLFGAPANVIAKMAGRIPKPGMLIPQDVPNQIQRLRDPIPIPDLSLVRFPIEHAERMTGISPTTMGAFYPTQRTATETGLVQQSVSAKVDDLIRNVHGGAHPEDADGLSEIARQTAALYYQYWDDWQDTMTLDVGKEALILPSLIEGHGISLFSSPESQRQRDILAWQMFGNNPLVTSQPANLARLARRVAESLGVGTDFLPSEDQMRESMVRAAVEETGKMVSGILGDNLNGTSFSGILGADQGRSRETPY